MAPSDPHASVSNLNDVYDIKSEIRRDATRAVYLARHRALGRDVMVNVVHVAGGQANDTLTHFTWDARLLATMRHDNVVPVVEGRWLDADTFAVVHALVRGSTLGERLTAKGPMTPTEVAQTLQQVRSALDWARTNGIIHRQLTTDTVAFQHDGERVMLTIGFTPLVANEVPDACADVRTIGTLAWSMLSGVPHESSAARSIKLAERRPGLSPALVAETHEMIECRPEDARRDVGAYIAMLGAAPPVAAPHAAPAYPIEAVPSSAANQAVVVLRRRLSVGPLVAVALVVVVAVAAGYFTMRARERARIAVNSSGAVTTPSDAAGSVESSPMNRTPPSVGGGPGSATRPIAPPIPPPTGVPVTPFPNEPEGPDPRVMRPNTTPVQPGAATPMTISPPREVVPRPRDTVHRDTVRRDSANDAMRRDSLRRDTVRRDAVPRDSIVRDTAARGAGATDPCASTGTGDQQRCFDSASGSADADMNRAFADLVATLRRRADVPEGAADPPTVVQLRAEQRQWLEDRKAECRRATDERDNPLWANRRAECFRERASQRARELTQKGTG